MDINKIIVDIQKRICLLEGKIDEVESPDNVWLTTGNLSITEDNFLGTLDDKTLIFRTFNQERARITNAGLFGIGTAAPTTTLDINGQIRIRGGVPGAGKVLTSNANGTATWETIIFPTPPAATVTGASNGLHLDGTIVKLGGSVTEVSNLTVVGANRVGLSGSSINGFGLLTVIDSGIGSGIVIVANNATGKGITVQHTIANGIAVNAVSGGGTAVSAFDGGIGIGVSAQSLGGIPLVSQSGIASSTTSTGLLLTRNHSSGAGVVGMGTDILMQLEDSGGPGDVKNAGKISSYWTDVTLNSEKSNLDLWTRNGATFDSKVSIKHTGQLQFTKYVGSAFPGTANKFLAADASGNIIQVNAPSPGGVGTVNTATQGLSLLSPTIVQLGQVFNALGDPALIDEVRQIPMDAGGSILISSTIDSSLTQTLTPNTNTLRGVLLNPPAIQLIVGANSLGLTWNNTDSQFQIASTTGLIVSTSLATFTGQVRIAGGNPATGRVLMSTNTIGLAEWVNVINDEIEFTPGDPGYPAVGSSIYLDSEIIGRKVLVVRNGLVQRGTNPGDGSTYITKTVGSNTITFSHALIATDYIQIIVI